MVLGGGQDASLVTTTDHRSGKFVAKFYDKVDSSSHVYSFCSMNVTGCLHFGTWYFFLYEQILQEEIGGVKGHFGPINALAFNPDGKRYSSIPWLLLYFIWSWEIFPYFCLINIASANDGQWEHLSTHCVYLYILATTIILGFSNWDDVMHEFVNAIWHLYPVESLNISVLMVIWNDRLLVQRFLSLWCGLLICLYLLKNLSWTEEFEVAFRSVLAFGF